MSQEALFSEEHFFLFIKSNNICFVCVIYRQISFLLNEIVLMAIYNPMTVNNGSRRMAIQSSKVFISLGIAEWLISAAFFGSLLHLETYLIEVLKFDDKRALMIWSGFAGFVFISSLIGGWIGGRYGSHKFISLLGFAFMVIGFSFVSVSEYFLFPGLALSSCGAGIIGPNFKVLFGSQPVTNAWQNYNRFTWLQAATVIGQISGITILGLLFLYKSWLLFFSAAICSALGAIIIILNYNEIVDDSFAKNDILYGREKYVTMGMIMFCLFALSLLVMWFDILSVIVYGVMFLTVILIAKIMYGSNQKHRQQIFSIILLMLGFLVFTICTKQEMSIMTVFAENFVMHKILNFDISMETLLLADPITYMILIFPFMKFAKYAESRNWKPNVPILFTISLIFIALAYLVLWISSGEPVEKKSPFPYIIYGILMGIGGFFMIPMGMAAVNELAPREWKSFFMGAWVFILTISATLNNLISGMFIPSQGHMTLLNYHDLFGWMLLGLVIITGLLSLCWFFWWNHLRRRKLQ